MGEHMTKEAIKFKYKNRRKPEYTKEGMVQLEIFQRQNQGTIGPEADAVLLGLKKRGHGRGKARDAGPAKRKSA
jgi:hypothetical protein